MTIQTQTHSVDGLSTKEIEELLLENSSENLKVFFKTETGQKLCRHLSGQMNHISKNKKSTRGLRKSRFDAESPETAQKIVQGLKDELISVCDKLGFDLQRLNLSSTTTVIVGYDVFIAEKEED